jgi:hexosaminidase
MKKSLCALALTGACCLFFSCAGTVGKADYNVIPLPKTVNVSDSTAFFNLTGSTTVIPDADSASQTNAKMLEDEMLKFTGISLKDAEGQEASKDAIYLRNDADAPVGSEAYTIDVTSDAITVTGSPAGQFYAIQTLCKAAPAGKLRKVQYPLASISDQPRFGYRGMHLDVSRHFVPLDTVKQYLDIMALHNMNVLHFHLTDDQGWRMEIKNYPLLTEVGSKRAQTVIGHNSGKYDGVPYGGFFTQEQMKELVAYAAARHITIIPEVDMPGHMMAALASYPELGCTGGPYKVWEQWGIADDVLCAGNPKTYDFITDVLNEIMDIFPSKYIHIGGDECPRVRWDSCSKCQAMIKSEKLDKVKDVKTPEDALQGYFMKFAEKIIEAKGRKVIGWDEILDGGQCDSATVMSWRGSIGGIKAARKGCDVIMSPNTYCYFDYYQTGDPAKSGEPLAIGGYIPVKKVYGFDPMPDSLTVDQQKHILGAQANIWTEYIPSGKHVIHMMIPRADALSEGQWCDPSQKDYDAFLVRLNRMRKLYDVMGYNYATYVFDGTDGPGANQAE